MLVLSRNPGESIVLRIHKPCEMTIKYISTVGYKSKKIKMGFICPPEVEVIREELLGEHWRGKPFDPEKEDD